MPIEVQVGWWCSGASADDFRFEPLDHPCELPNRLPVYFKVEPVGDVSDTDTSCAPDRPESDRIVADTGG